MTLWGRVEAQRWAMLSRRAIRAGREVQLGRLLFRLLLGCAHDGRAGDARPRDHQRSCEHQRSCDHQRSCYSRLSPSVSVPPAAFLRARHCRRWSPLAVPWLPHGRCPLYLTKRRWMKTIFVWTHEKAVCRFALQVGT